MWTRVYTRVYVYKSRIPFYSDFCYNFRIVFHGKCAIRFLKWGENHFKKHSITNICEHFNFIHLIHTVLQRIGPGEGQVHCGRMTKS